MKILDRAKFEEWKKIDNKIDEEFSMIIEAVEVLTEALENVNKHQAIVCSATAIELSTVYRIANGGLEKVWGKDEN